MKSFYILVIILSYFGNLEANELNYNIGIGTTHSGIGIKVISKVDDLNYFVSLGCNSISVSSDNSSCGGGIGISQMRVFNFMSSNQSLGLYLGMVNQTYNFESHKHESIYGVSINFLHHQYSNKINGYEIGLSPSIGTKEGDVFML